MLQLYGARCTMQAQRLYGCDTGQCCLNALTHTMVLFTLSNLKLLHCVSHKAIFGTSLAPYAQDIPLD